MITWIITCDSCKKEFEGMVSLKVCVMNPGELCIPRWEEIHERHFCGNECLRNWLNLND